MHRRKGHRSLRKMIASRSSQVETLLEKMSGASILGLLLGVEISTLNRKCGDAAWRRSLSGTRSPSGGTSGRHSNSRSISRTRPSYHFTCRGAETRLDDGVGPRDTLFDGFLSKDRELLRPHGRAEGPPVDGGSSRGRYRRSTVRRRWAQCRRHCGLPRPVRRVA